ncbi:MAG: fatty acyl-AMP ligase [Alphaproteobacteria bacterium]|nr:fatty acyl-AMP ligase [Alphaproteobacteria bacterium]
MTGSLAVLDKQVAANTLVRTPTSNRDLPQKVGGFGTLAESLDYAAQGLTGFNFYSGRGVLEQVLPYSDLRSRALITARKLLSLGLHRMERVAIVAETGPDFMVTFFGCQYAGLVPCPIPYSMYIGGREAYVARIAGMLKAAHATAVISTDAQIETLREAAAQGGISTVLSHADVALLPETLTKLHGFGTEDVAYIQYSSGSTSAPKGVLISQRAIMTNGASILRDGIDVKPTDRGFSWLPLYHDMGLVGFCLSTMMGQSSMDYLATTAFARRPTLWLKLMSDNRTTVSFSPTFGYDLVAKRVGAELAGLDLSAWRAAGIGGDMVRPDVLKRFADAVESTGFDRKSFMPSYGMAESTLAMTFALADRDIKIDRVDRAALRGQNKAVPSQNASDDVARDFVVCGKIVSGHVLEVRGEAGQILGEREIGKIFVKGPSLMLGYYENHEATKAVIGEDGFLDTGDMGYLLEGEIVITGRAKDLILHNGRNIWPQDIEWAAEQMPVLKSGDVAAFAVEGADGDDEVVVLVECRLSDVEAQENLRRDVGKIVHQSSGVDCAIVLVAPKSLPFTSSGKLSRAQARKSFLAGEMSVIGQTASA